MFEDPFNYMAKIIKQIFLVNFESVLCIVCENDIILVHRVINARFDHDVTLLRLAHQFRLKRFKVLSIL